MGVIRINYAAAETAAGNLRAASAQLDMQLTDFTAAGNAMAGRMGDAAQMEFQTAQLQAQDSFRRLAGNVERVARLLDEHVVGIRAADHQAATRIRQI